MDYRPLSRGENMFSDIDKHDDTIKTSNQGQITTLKQTGSQGMSADGNQILFSNKNKGPNGVSASSLIGNETFHPGPMQRDSYKLYDTEGSIVEGSDSRRINDIRIKELQSDKALSGVRASVDTKPQAIIELKVERANSRMKNATVTLQDKSPDGTGQVRISVENQAALESESDATKFISKQGIPAIDMPGQISRRLSGITSDATDIEANNMKSNGNRLQANGAKNAGVAEFIEPSTMQAKSSLSATNAPDGS